MASDLRKRTHLGGRNAARWQKVRLAVLERDGWTCQLRYEGCTGRAEEVDHIIPRQFGGPMFDPDNLRAVCATCHDQRRYRYRPPSRAGASRDWYGGQA
jgi:5-methylcytosine-specific restriction endonuclease McrA